MPSPDRPAGDLERFVVAQDAVWDDVVAELSAGDKRTHWMWFVFPQLAGLGRSPTARRFAIGSLGEAVAYLAHPVLGPRLVECATLVERSSSPSAERIFGEVDARKLRSSMTLFERVNPAQAVFEAVLDRYYAGRRDDATLTLLRPDGPR